MNRQKIYEITCITFIIDQLLKIIIRNTINLNQEIKVIKNFFSITYLKNTGAAFSILENMTLLLVVISVLFIIFLDKFIKKEEKAINKFSIFYYGIIIGGIFGNLIDRIISKSVTDYLSFTIFNYNFPVFNFADICITIGVLLLIIDTVINEVKTKNTNNGGQQ